MKFTVERSSFSEAVSKLQKGVGTKTSLPVLEGILISAEKGRLTLASYNLEIGIKKEIYASCEEEGDIVINARLLSDILRRISSIQVEIEADEHLLCHIKGGEAVFDIMGMAASDFPEMPSVADGEKLCISGELFSDMVRGTIFAVSQIEGTRPILTGINISLKNNVLQFVAIDGYRLAIRRKKVEIDGDTEFIIAGRAINEMVKLITEETENIEMTVSKRLISFDIDGYIFISRLLDGEFVNYQKIIPAEYKQTAVFSTHELIETVERVSLLISDTFTTPVRCVFDNNKVTVSCATSIGRATEKIDCEISGESFEIGLNSRYMLEALRASESGAVTFKFNGANSGVLISDKDESNDEFLYLIMPVRLK